MTIQIEAEGVDQEQPHHRQEEEEEDDDDDEDDDVTVIVLENSGDDDEVMAHGWVDQDSPEMQERRRNVLLRELQRVQRASFRRRLKRSFWSR